MNIVPLSVPVGAYMESQSGLQRGKPQIFCRYERPAGVTARSAYVLIHPTSNFHDHYLIDSLVDSGAAVLAINTRYVGNDSMLIMERAILDLGRGIAFLREQSHDKIVLIGNSGGGSLAALYQQQAERLTIVDTPDRRPITIAPDDLPPADAVALVAAHPGRAAQLLNKIDGSVLDEGSDPRVDSSLDIFDPRNGPPFTPEWMMRYRRAQKHRLRRIADWAVDRLARLEDERSPDAADEAFVIHRTQADPRNIDLTLDANDRRRGTLGGEAKAYDLAANGLARFCTLRSFLSQWSPWHTRASGPACLAQTRVPVFIADFTGDQTVFPSNVADWRQAAGDRGTYWALRGAPHYLIGQPDMIAQVTSRLTAWASDKLE